MLEIKQYDEIIAMTREERMEAWSGIDSHDLYRAYADSKERGLEVLDVRNVILPERAGELVRSMRGHGIRRFTLSSYQDGLQNLLAELCDSRCSMLGMTVVPSGERTFVHGSNTSVPVMLDAITLLIH